MSTDIELLHLIPCSKEVSSTASAKKRHSTVSVGKVSIDPNLWRAEESFLGEATMMCKNGDVITENNITIPKVLKDTYAYHEVIYGPKPWGMPLDHPPSVEPAKLPKSVYLYTNIKRIALYVDFFIHRLDQATNIAYDIWLTRAPRYTGGPRPEDIELMVWIYRGSNSSWLPPPAGSKICDIDLPMAVGETIYDVSWEVWHHPGVPWGGWRYIAFVSSKPVLSAAIDLTEFLKSMKSIFGIDKLEEYYVNDIEIGTEVYAYQQGLAGIQWRLKKFAIATAPISVSSERILSVFNF